jgi:predicted DNA-binding protein (UPF0251 family)
MIEVAIWRACPLEAPVSWAGPVTLPIRKFMRLTDDKGAEPCGLKARSAWGSGFRDERALDSYGHMLVTISPEVAMPRPRCCRRVSGSPACTIFKPAGIPAASLEEVVLSIDEYEAIRLADHEGLYHEQAAEKMGVSRQTFGRIVGEARRKVAKALVLGLALRIEGVEVAMEEARTFVCACGHAWDLPYGTGRPASCPACLGQDFHRVGCTGNRAGNALEDHSGGDGGGKGSA